MLWSECYGKIQQMSPKAAKLASRMLCKDPRVPSHWAFALDVALAGRGKASGSFTSADLEAIGGSRGQEQTAPPAGLDPEQREAWAFADSVRTTAAVSANWLETDSHRNPVVAARDEFMAGEVRNFA